jgi:hypothetical protein
MRWVEQYELEGELHRRINNLLHIHKEEIYSLITVKIKIQ